MEHFRTNEGTPIDVARILQRTCCCIVAEVVFGENYKLDDKELADMVKAGSGWVNLFYTEAVFMYFVADMFPRWLGKLLYGTKLAMVKTKTDSLLDYMSEKIKKHQLIYDREHPQCLADDYMNATVKDSSLSFSYLVGTIMMFIPDAIDTMSHQLVWGILFLSQRPHLQKELQKEIEELCGERPVRLADRNKLFKLVAFIQETFR